MSEIMLSKKIIIYPTESQKQKINRYIDLYRFVYNWTIAREQEQYELYKEGKSDFKFLRFFNMSKEYIKMKNNDKPWLKEFPIDIARCAIRDAIHSFEYFFKGFNGYPKFKSKKSRKRSCSIGNRKFYFNDNMVKIKGFARGEMILTGYHTYQYKKDNIIYYNPTISIDNFGNYWLTYSEKKETISLNIPKSNPIGIDLGIRNAFTLSTGETFNYPKEKISRLDKSIKRQQRQFQKDHNRLKKEAKQAKTKLDNIKRSNRAVKRLTRLRKTIKKKYDIINTFDHTVTKNIVMRNPSAIVMETLNIQNSMLRNRPVAQKLNNNFFYNRKEKMRYKCEKYNIPFIQAPINYKSSQICNNCGNIHNNYSNHLYHCHICGMIEDRDINAAKNLMKLALI